MLLGDPTETGLTLDLHVHIAGEIAGLPYVALVGAEKFSDICITLDCILRVLSMRTVAQLA